jgi:hypothetical protein
MSWRRRKPNPNEAVGKLLFLEIVARRLSESHCLHCLLAQWRMSLTAAKEAATATEIETGSAIDTSKYSEGTNCYVPIHQNHMHGMFRKVWMMSEFKSICTKLLVESRVPLLLI